MKAQYFVQTRVKRLYFQTHSRSMTRQAKDTSTFTHHLEPMASTKSDTVKTILLFSVETSLYLTPLHVYMYTVQNKNAETANGVFSRKSPKPSQNDTLIKTGVPFPKYHTHTVLAGFFLAEKHETRLRHAKPSADYYL